MWQNYIVSEGGKLSQFSNMERIKLASKSLHQAININFLLESKYIIDIFPLNEYYELFGKSRKVYFEPFTNPDIN